MRPLHRAIFILLLIFPSFAPAEGRFFDSAGVKIRYVEQGKGVPVVLIHGFSRNIEINWIEPGILDALADNYRVDRIRLPGTWQERQTDGH